MDKIRVIEALCEQQKKGAKKSENLLKKEREELASLNHSGTKSDYTDPTRVELQNKVSRLTREIKSAERCLATLRNLSRDRTLTISPGSLVVVEDCENREQDIYLLVPEEGRCGGCVVEIDGASVTCLSIRAPLAETILCRMQGEIVGFQIKKYKIVAVE